MEASARPRTGAFLVPGGHHVGMKEHHISEPRINDRIRVPEVRLVGPNGEQVGIVRIETALQLAQESDLDLVEVAPQARPPVCKLMDFGKYKYESAMKAREARKNQAHTVLKEIRLRLKIDPHDYGTKRGHVERFLKQGDKVKVMIMFRGREQSRPEMGYRLLQRMAADVAELGFVESTPKQDGRNMIMVIGPHKKKAEAKAEQRTRRRDETPDELDPSAYQDNSYREAPAAPAPAATATPAARTVAPARAAAAVQTPAPAQPAVTVAPTAPAPTPAPARAPARTATPARTTAPAPTRTAAPAAAAPAAAAPAAGSAPATPKPAPRPAAPRPAAPKPAPAAKRPAPSVGAAKRSASAPADAESNPSTTARPAASRARRPVSVTEQEATAEA
jgi:translation initiation factor IF-3